MSNAFSIIKTGRFKALQEFLENNFHQTTVNKVICSLNYSFGKAVLHPTYLLYVLLDEKSLLITKAKVAGKAQKA